MLRFVYNRETLLNDGSTLLDYNVSTDCAIFLLRKIGVVIPATPENVVGAARDGNSKLLRKLLEKGGDPNSQDT